MNLAFFVQKDQRTGIQRVVLVALAADMNQGGPVLPLQLLKECFR